MTHYEFSAHGLPDECTAKREQIKDLVFPI